MLLGIRLCCCWSKLHKVSPCWPASNPPLMDVVGARGWCSARGQSAEPVTLPKGEPFHCFLFGEHRLFQTSEISGEHLARAAWQTAKRMGFSHRAGKAAALPNPLSQIPIKDVPAGRQQWHISMTLLSLDSTVYKGTFSCIQPCFFFTYSVYTVGMLYTQASKSTHGDSNQTETFKHLKAMMLAVGFCHLLIRQPGGWPLIVRMKSNKQGKDRDMGR